MARLANQPTGQWKTNIYEATQHLTASYAALSTYAQRLVELQKKAGGLPLPCDVLDSYNQAVNDYLSFGRRVFDVLSRNKISVEQIVYRAGKPVVDEKGVVKTLKIDAPLRPPTWVLTTTQCPGITRVAGATDMMGRKQSEIGLIPVIVIAGFEVGGLLFVGLAGIISIVILKTIGFIVWGPDYGPQKLVEAQLDCVDQNLKRGFTHEQILKLGCDKITSMKRPDPVIGGFGITTIALGVAAIGGIAYVITKK